MLFGGPVNVCEVAALRIGTCSGRGGVLMLMLGNEHNQHCRDWLHVGVEICLDEKGKHAFAKWIHNSTFTEQTHEEQGSPLCDPDKSSLE